MSPEDVLTWLEGQKKRPTRVQVARYYMDLLMEHWYALGDLDVERLNRAIQNRWSDAGLQWIKAAAWRAAAGTIRINAKLPRTLLPPGAAAGAGEAGK